MADNIAEIVDGQESGIAAILREGVERHKSSVRDDDIPMTQDGLGAAVELATAVEDTATDDSPGHASSLNATLRQAKRDGDMPESTEDYSVLRTAVDGDRLNGGNALDYLVLLALEGKRYSGNWDGDDTEIAKWVVAQWQQELGWAPDLTPFNAGQQVPRGFPLESCPAVFYESARAGQEVADD